MRYSKYPFLLCSVACCLASASLFGTALTVNVVGDTNTAAGGSFAGTSGDLRGVINYINQNPGSHTVTFNLGASNTINLSAMLPIINLNAANTISFDGANSGNKIIIDGGNNFRGFFVRQGSVTINNLDIQNVKAQGGAGGVGGLNAAGGGMGAGAALFVDGATVTLTNVSVSKAVAQGGNGAFSSGDTPGSGGGGGLGGNGGIAPDVPLSATASAGGGGIGGIGGTGTSTANTFDAGGGGGGINCGTNHDGAGGTAGSAGSTGGGLGSASAGSGSDIGGGAGGASGGGGGAGRQGNAISPGGNGGGGGVGGSNATASGGGAGGAGGYGGGGGGAGVIAAGNTGGAGGFGGGGGGGYFLAGGSGGFGGGGGGGGFAGFGGVGGNGGFGGGGGGGSPTFGAGGIGGGRGASELTFGGLGGGGAGFGGALFVNTGTLTIKGAFSTGSGGNASTTAAGAGVDGGTVSSAPGWAAGNDAFFLTGSSITLDPNGFAITFNSSIADDSAASFVGAPTGVTLGSAGGVALTIGNVSSSPGTATLITANTYSGGTTIQKGTLSIHNNGSLGSGILTFAANGTTLQAGASNLIISNPVRITGNGAIDSNGTTITIAGTVSDFTPGGILTKTGAGTLSLIGANTYTGGTNLNQGTLSIGNITAIGSGTLTFGVNDGNILLPTSSLAISNSIALSKNGIIDSNGQTIAISGNISGAGSLTKDGAGTLILTGANDYSGGTTVSAGTLEGNTTSLQGAILNNASVVFNQTSAGTYAGQMSGTGSLNKIGAGQLIVSGNNTYSGATTVSSGMLTLNGSIISPLTTLSGTFLNGNGTITGDTVIGGTLGPGTSIGTFRIIGNITFQTGSTFQVEANPLTADLLDIDATGNITIESGATIEVTPAPGAYRVNTLYNVATAGESGGSVIGTFTNVVNTYPAIQARVLYTNTFSSDLTDTALATNTISLVLDFMPFSAIVDKRNPKAIAETLDDFTPPENTDIDFVIEQLYFLPNVGALTEALNQMQPSLLNNISLAQQNSSLFVSSAFTKHTSDLRLTRSPCTELGDKRWEVWGDGSIDWARQRGNHQNVGFHASTQLGAGGFDYRINKNFYLGVLGAYTYTSINCKDHLAKGTVNTYYTGLYGSLLYPRFFANLSLVGDFADYHSTRRVQFGLINRRPKGHHHGYGAIAHLDLGASLPAERRAQCYPYGALDYVYQHEKGYTETKALSLNNNIRSKNTSMLRSELGLQGRYCSSIGQDVIIPSAKIGWVYEARFQGEKINARLVDVPSRYTVVGLYPNRSMLAVGASLTGVLCKQRAHLSLTYEGLFGSGYKSNAGNISLNLQF